VASDNGSTGEKSTVDAVVLTALAELKALLGEQTRRLDAFMVRSDEYRKSDHDAISQLKTDMAVMKEWKRESDTRRIPWNGIATGVAALAGLVLIVMQLGNVINWG